MVSNFVIKYPRHTYFLIIKCRYNSTRVNRDTNGSTFKAVNAITWRRSISYLLMSNVFSSRRSFPTRFSFAQRAQKRIFSPCLLTHTILISSGKDWRIPPFWSHPSASFALNPPGPSSGLPRVSFASFIPRYKAIWPYDLRKDGKTSVIRLKMDFAPIGMKRVCARARALLSSKREVKRLQSPVDVHFPRTCWAH